MISADCILHTLYIDETSIGQFHGTLFTEQMTRVQPVWTLSGVAIGVTALVWTKFRNYNDHSILLPYLLSLVQALLDNVDRLQLEVMDAEVDDGAKRWNFFVEELITRLTAVEEKLLEVSESTVGLNGLDRVNKELDKELVKFLRLEPGVASILDSYLPRPGQTWIDFIQNKPRTKDQEEFYKKVSSEKSLQVELKETLRGAVKELKEILLQSSLDVTRGAGDESEVETLSRHKPVKVFFATDRKVTANGEYVGNISTRVDAALQLSTQYNVPLHFGWVEVGIPEVHQKGVLEAPSNAEDADPSKHVVIFTVNAELRGNLTGFLKQVDADLKSEKNEGELLVYIHGYNVSHLSAVKQAAQLKYDLKFKGTIILYSWSSKGTLDGYYTDQRNVKRTVASLETFLNSIMGKVKAPGVNILAHSMGNRALIGALQALYDKPGAVRRPSPRPCPLSQIIFVAADEEPNLFKKLLQTINEIYTASSSSTNGSTSRTDLNGINSETIDRRPHLTVYCSTKDWALTFSRYVHWKHRLGDINSLFDSTEDLSAIGDHDVIDVTGTSEGGIFQLHHSYHVQSTRVIQDIQLLLEQKSCARERSEYLHFIKNFKGKSFYAFEPESWTR